MLKRKCNNTDIEFSVMGTGCWAFGGGDYWGSQNQKDVTKVVHAAVDFGINYFDTAEAYNEGRSELSLGKAIKDLSRDKLIIGTKISPSNCYPDKIDAHCHASLERLGTDYIDMYMIHWPIHPHSIKHFTKDSDVILNPPRIEEAIEGLRKLKKDGKIRHFGVSNFARTRMDDLPLSEIAVNELPYNLLCRAIEYDILPYCQKNGIGVISYMALLQGVLTGVYPNLDDVPKWRRRTRHFNSTNSVECRHGESGVEQETNRALHEVGSLSNETGIKMSDLAIKWILENSGVTCTLVGSRNIEQLKENVKALDITITAETKRALDTITAPIMEKLGNHFDYYESAQKDRTI